MRCDAHGEQVARVVFLFRSWTDPVCPVCSAEETARWEAEEESRRRQSERERLAQQDAANLDRSGIPPRFQGYDLGSYRVTSDGQRKALAACRGYASAFGDHRKRGTSLILCGHAGTGKTHVACALVREVILAHHVAAVYTTAGRAFRAVKGTYRRDSDASEGEVISGYARPALLVVDEVGVQYGSDAERNILFEIVNERYEAMKPTVLVSNLSVENLREFAGDRVLDRLKDHGGKLVVFDWQSHRGVRDPGEPMPTPTPAVPASSSRQWG